MRGRGAGKAPGRCGGKAAACVGWEPLLFQGSSQPGTGSQPKASRAHLFSRRAWMGAGNPFACFHTEGAVRVRRSGILKGEGKPPRAQESALGPLRNSAAAAARALCSIAFAPLRNCRRTLGRKNALVAPGCCVLQLQATFAVTAVVKEASPRPVVSEAGYFGSSSTFCVGDACPPGEVLWPSPAPCPSWVSSLHP